MEHDQKQTDQEQTGQEQSGEVDAEETNVEEADVEKPYATNEVVAKLRRLADALEAGKTFNIQIAGKRISVPPHAMVEFEYERSGDDEEIEIELKWKRVG